MLYAAELAWSRQKGAEGEYQRAINRMGRSTLGSFRSTPQGIVAGESGLTPARALLNHRKTRFTQRLFARPRVGDGLEEVLTRWFSMRRFSPSTRHSASRTSARRAPPATLSPWTGHPPLAE